MKEFKLSKPVTVGQTTVESIHLREPTVGEVLSALKHVTETTSGGLKVNNFDGANLDAFFRELIIKTSTQPGNVVDELPLSAINQSIAYLETFPIWSGRKSSLDDVDAEPEPEVEYEDPHMIALDAPLMRGTQKVSEIYLTEPTFKQIQQADAETKGGITLESANRKMLKLLSVQTEIPTGFLNMLSITKFREAEKVMGFFLEKARQT